MTSLPFSELTDDQRAQVAYLFADQIFGTDVNAFAYELNEKGEVKGRSRIAQSGCAEVKRSRQNSPVIVHMIEEVHITEDMINRVNMSMDALAASIAQRIYQSQNQSIEMENS
jgi:hypothetical protein